MKRVIKSISLVLSFVFALSFGMNTCLNISSTVVEALTNTQSHRDAIGLSHTLPASQSSITINSNTFPDEIFRQYISTNIDTDHNGVLNTSEIEKIRHLDISDMGISSLSGIEFFYNLSELRCPYNNLSTLDVSHNSNLDSLYCYNNNISTINLGYKISTISCGWNPLQNIDLSHSPNLRALHCLATGISSIDVSGTIIGQYIESGTVENHVEEGITGDLYFSDYPSMLFINAGVTVLVNGHTAVVPTPTPTTAPTSTTTPTPTAAPATAAPTSSPATSNSTATPAASTATGVAGFVERLYTVALGRASDPAGQQQWVDTITSGQNTGADVARGFLYSPEFLNRNSSNEDFVRTLYRTFFGREADGGGLAAWVGVLNAGESRHNVIEGFINSTEWANLCLSYGIPSGGTGSPNIDVEPNQGTIDFCTRLYTTCLNRSADQGGLMAWARQLANQRDTGTGAARGFFFSSEFLNQNVDNGEFVTRLYRTFMGREPDQTGYNAWVGQLNAGASREEVFNGFAQSQEFTVICAQYGIVRGS